MKILFVLLFIALPVFSADLRSVRITPENGTATLCFSLRDSESFDRMVALSSSDLSSAQQTRISQLQSFFDAANHGSSTMASLTLEFKGPAQSFSNSVAGGVTNRVFYGPVRNNISIGLVKVKTNGNGCRTFTASSEDLPDIPRDRISAVWDGFTNYVSNLQ